MNEANYYVLISQGSNYPNYSPWDRIKSVYDTTSAGYPSSLLFQATVSFAIGLAFSPWSYGLLYLIIFIIIYEIIYALIHRNFSCNNIVTRVIIIAASVAGFFLGRIILGDRQCTRARYRDHCHKVGCKNYHYPSFKNKHNSTLLTEFNPPVNHLSLPICHRNKISHLMPDIINDLIQLN